MNRYPGRLHCTFDLPEKLAQLSLLKELKPSTDRKMIKILAFYNYLTHYDVLVKRRSRMTTAIMFFRRFPLVEGGNHHLFCYCLRRQGEGVS